MNTYKPPLAVFFIWHPADEISVKPIVEHCHNMLKRNIDKPFSRAMNLPIFFRTTLKKGVPSEIKTESKYTIIVPFISKDVVGDDEWVKYIESLPKEDSTYYVPIALDRTAFTLGGRFQYVNFIRAYDFKKENCNHMAFISIAHEIYRLILNENFDEIKLGIDNAIEIFLSHAKDGKHGLALAKALKGFIDNTSMRNFFDSNDIAPGYMFDKEIIGHIKRSTLIAIHSDPYSSRYWCQREIICAKENKRPIIAVDCLEDFEDRRFPFAANVPGVHVHLENVVNIDEKDLLRILSAVLLETIRFYYAKLTLSHYKEIKWVPDDAVIVSRPPEPADIFIMKQLAEKNSGTIGKIFLYPEPPVYEDELLPLKCAGYNFFTPLSCSSIDLHPCMIGLSISNPSNEELVSIGHNSEHLVSLSQEIARHLLARGATLVYGGDLRENGFTDFIFKEASALQSRLQTQDIHLENYIAWPIYTKDSNLVKEWKAKYRQIAKMIEIAPPKDVERLIPNRDLYMTPTNTQNNYVWSRCLTEMRKNVLKKCNIMIFVGGKHNDFRGKMPGILEEMILALEKKIPVFLLGGFGGITSSVCRSIENKTLVDELTESWLLKNNPGYSELLKFALEKGSDYSNIFNSIKTLQSVNELNNGLSIEENNRLFKTQFIDEAIFLILKGVGVQLKKMR